MHRRAILLILTLALTLSYVDRYLLAVLIQPIKAELGLSDSQIGLLTGFAFSAFYVALGLPLARLADRGFHRAVICLSVAAWSIMTALTSTVQGFVHMALARFGVGAGEAGVFPTSQAVLAEIFPPEKRTGAMAIFTAGGSIGLLIAFAVGSWVEAHVGWRWTFVVMAAPGLIVAPLAFWVLPAKVAGSAAAKPAAGVFRALWANRHFRHLPFAQAAVVVLLFGQAQWLPAFFERSFGVGRVELGATLGLTQGVATILGGVGGGLLADRLRARDLGWPLRLAILSLITGTIPLVLLYLCSDIRAAYVLAALSGLFFSVPAGPIAAHLQFVVAPWQRASAAAWAAMIASFVGLGAGPFLVGAVSDLLAPCAGRESLRYALLIVGLAAAVWAMWHLARLLRLPVTHDGAASQVGAIAPQT